MAASVQALRAPRAQARRVATRRQARTRAAAQEPPPPASVVPFVPPEPKRFTVAPGKLLDTAACAAGFLFRGTSGALAAGYAIAAVDDAPGVYAVGRAAGKMSRETSSVASFPRPAQPLVLYEFEACPFCKRVREAAVHFDLDIVFYPCPRDGPTFRPEAIAAGGKKQFPYFKDPNTGVALYESAAIIRYMADTYGDGVIPGGLGSSVAPILIGLGLLPRLGRGGKYRPSRVSGATQPLTLWAYEASPFCKLVREVLCELEIPHLLKTAARGSPKRDELFAKTGLFQVPYLEDPNTGAAMFESAFIVDYLERTYGLQA